MFIRLGYSGLGYYLQIFQWEVPNQFYFKVKFILGSVVILNVHFSTKVNNLSFNSAKLPLSLILVLSGREVPIEVQYSTAQ